MFTLRDRTIFFEGAPILSASIPYGEGPDGSTNHRNIDPSVFDELLREVVAGLNERRSYSRLLKRIAEGVDRRDAID